LAALRSDCSFRVSSHQLRLARPNDLDGRGPVTARRSLPEWRYLDITCCAIVLAPLLVGRRADLRSVWRDDRRNLLIASAATIASGVLVLAALARGPAAYVAAARETSILFATALGAWLLRERVGRWQIAGLGCVAVGLVLIALVA
jgi:drug/metabolite transporter (DMT)-like permease